MKTEDNQLDRCLNATLEQLHETFVSSTLKNKIMKTKQFFKSKIQKLSMVIVLFIVLSLNLRAIHPSMDTLDWWVEVNDGLGKCALDMKTSGSYLNFKKDDFDVLNVTNRRGLLYINVAYGQGHLSESDPEYCKGGWFVHDTLTNKWYRVADEAPKGYYNERIILTNNREIFELNNGEVYQMTFDYVTYPNGWKKISRSPHSPLSGSYVASACGCDGACYSGTSIFGQSSAIDAVGDTIFIIFSPRSGSSSCPDDEKTPILGKFSVKDGYWKFQKLPDFPRGTNFMEAIITDYIAGMFRFFVKYRDPYTKLETTKFGGLEGFDCGMSTDFPAAAMTRAIWVYDPRNNTWRDISRGPDWCNFTASAATGVGQIKTSFNKKRLIIANQRGTWEWKGDGWDFLNDRTKGIEIVTTNGIYYGGGDHSGSLGGGGSNIERFINANFMILGPMDDPHNVCEGESYNTHYRNISSANDGKSIYGFLWEKDLHCYNGVEPQYTSDDGMAYYGVYHLIPDETKPQSARNLHVEAATYLGASGADNIPINVGVGDGYKLYVAGNYNGVTGRKMPNYSANEKFYNGATSASRGKIIVLNKWADTIVKAIHLGNQIYTYEIQNWPPFRMVVSGDWGISVLDSSGNQLWSKPISSFGGSGTLRADIDDKGNVAVLNTSNKKFYVTDPTGNVKNTAGTSTDATTSVGVMGNVYNTNTDYIYDIAIKNDTVFVAGMNNNSLSGVAICGESAGLPVQSNFLRAFKPNGTNYTYMWRLWDIQGQYLGSDQADSRLYRINMGKDGKLYVMGEQANSNGPFRWDGWTSVELEARDHGGCDQGSNHGTSKTVSIDKYNTLWGFCRAVHITYFCTVDPVRGKVERGMFTSSLANDGCKNSFLVRNGYIHADAKGYVYITGASSARYPNREVQYINGKLIGEYAGGDGVVMITSPDYRARTFCGAFSDTVADGTMCGVGIRDNWIAMVGYHDYGKLITGATRVTDPKYNIRKFNRSWAINPNPLNQNWSGDANIKKDAYIAVWYQNLWDFSQDTLEENIIIGDPIISHEAFNCDADFRVKEIPTPPRIQDQLVTSIDVCPNQEITFEDLSECAEEWEWDFGVGARVGPNFLNSQAVGKGPWVVKYLTPGTKTITLRAKLRTELTNGNPTYRWVDHFKYDYVNVVDDKLELDEIQGPKVACAGTEVYYEVSAIYGMDGFEWEFPAGTTIIDGATANKIRVILGSTSGTVRVRGKLPCGGYTAAKAINVSITIPNENSVMMVVGDDRIIVDNNSPGYSESVTEGAAGSISQSTSSYYTGYHGSNYRHFQTSDDNDKVICTYTPTLPSDGYYEVFIKYPMLPNNHATDYYPMGRVKINYNGGSNTSNIDQLTTYGARWISLGTYNFKAGAGNNVVLSADKGVRNSRKNTIYADAFAFKKVGLPVLSAGDSSVYKRFTTSLSKIVTIKTDNEIQSSDAGCAALIYISSTADARNIEYKLTDAATPIISSNSNTYSYLGLAFAGGQKGIVYNKDAVNIQTSAHELSAGFGTGKRTVYSNTSNGLSWGAPAASAVIVATVDGDNSKATIFAYDNSCPMQGSNNNAPERRMAFYLDNNGAKSLTTDGWKLFDKAVCWSLGTCAASTNTITITGVNNATICPGDSLEVTFNATGTYGTGGGSYCNPSNRFAVVISDAYGTFAGNPIELGSKQSTSNGTQKIKVYVPMTFIAGNQYKLRIESSNPSSQSSPYGTITVRDYPDDAGPITGPLRFCLNEVPQGTYSVAAGAQQYRWVLPMGAVFKSHVAPPTKPFELLTTSNTVTVNFQASTETTIEVWKKDGCGWSLNPSRLIVVRGGTPPGPNVPSTLGGMSPICPGGEYTYSVPMIDFTEVYNWTVPSSLGTIIKNNGNNITIKATNNDLVTGTITMIASNTCGSAAAVTKLVKTDRTANLPNISGGVEVIPSACAGVYTFRIDPVNDASSYNWTVSPSGYTITTATPYVNSVDVTFTKSGTFTVTAFAVNGCGSSSKSTTVTVSTSGKRALLLALNKSSLTTTESDIKSRLEGLGYAVTSINNADNLGTQIYCNQLMVISPDAMDGSNEDVGSKYKTSDIPIIVCNDAEGNSSNTTENLGMTDQNSYGGTQYGKTIANQTKIDVVSTCHPITESLDTGLLTVYSAADDMSWGTPPFSNATILAMIQGDSKKSALFVYDKNDKMFNTNIAPARRVSFFLASGSSGQMNTAAWSLFDNSVLWASGTVGNPELSITSLSATTLCTGSTTNTINYAISTPGWAVNKTVVAQLSNKYGAWDTYTQIGSVSTKASGVLNLTIPAGLDSSANYRIRLYVPSCGIYVLYPNTIKVRVCNVCPPTYQISDSVITDVKCFGQSTGSINITVTGGATPYTYSWSNAAVSKDITNVLSGKYNVTVTDKNSCLKTARMSIDQPASALSVLGVKTDVSCSGGNNGSITLTVSGGTTGYTYTWSGGGNSATLINKTAGTYTATITDSKSCTVTSSFNIGQPTGIMSITSVTNVSCNSGNDGSVSLGVSGGVGPYTYSWNTTYANNVISGKGAGSYNVTITDANLCTKTLSQTITQPTSLTVVPTLAHVAPAGNNNGSISLAVSGGTTGYSYSWNDGSTLQNRTALTAKTYNVTISDSKSCSLTGTFTLTEPGVININPLVSDVKCFGGNNGKIKIIVSGGTSPFTYSWSVAGTKDSIVNLTAGTYTVTVRDQVPSTKVATFTVGQAIDISITPTVSNVSCNSGNDGGVSLVVTGGTTPYTYSWNTTNSGNAISNKPQGNYNLTITDANSCSKIATYTITQPTAIVVISALTQVSAKGGNDGAITQTVSGGSGTYTYIWNDSQTGKDRTNLLAGTYSVTISDASLCSKTAVYTITEPDLITISATQTNVSCHDGNNGRIQLTVNGGVTPYTYVWSNGNTTSLITTLVADTFTVTVTDKNLITKTASYIIEQPDTMMISGSINHNNCFGQNIGEIMVNVLGGTSPYSYLWNDGSTLNTISGKATGVYTITVKDANNCSVIGTYIITEPAIISVSGVVTNCTSADSLNGSILQTISGGTPDYKYNWSVGGASKDKIKVGPGSYLVTITDNNSCTATSSYVITQPLPIILTPSITHIQCNGSATGIVNVVVSGGVTPYTYSWDDGSTIASISGKVAGVYSLTVTDKNMVTKTADYTVIQPDVLSITEVINHASCTNGTGDIFVTSNGGVGPYTYSWSTLGSGAAITNKFAGTYNLTITDNNSCSKIVSYVITEPSLLNVTEVLTHVAISGGTTGAIDLTVTGGTPIYGYSWSTNLTTKDLTSIKAGTYTVTVIDSKLCSRTASYVITEPPSLNVIPSISHVTCNGAKNGSVTLNVSGGVGPYSFVWNVTGSSSSITSLNGGTYSVTITDKNGAQQLGSYVVKEPLTISVVPTSINVNCNGGNNGAISLSVSGGRTPYIYSWNVASASSSISSLLAGTYTVTITDSSNCAFNSSFVITQPDKLIITGDTIDVTVNGANDGSINVTVVGGVTPYTYLWSNGLVTQDLSALAQGIYTITVTDKNGCNSQRTFIINEPSPITVTVVSKKDIKCFDGSDGEIVLTAVGGIKPYTYSWTSGSLDSIASNLKSGTYIVTVKDVNGAKKVMPISISQPNQIIITSSQTDVSCNGISNGAINISVTGGIGTYSYSWSNTNTVNNVSGLAAGSFSVIVSDVNSCTATASYTLSQPDDLDIIVSSFDVSCFGSSNGSIIANVTGGTTPYAFSWSNNQSTQVNSGLKAALYSVTVVDKNLCSKTLQSITITEPTEILISSAITHVKQNGMPTGKISLTVTGGTSSISYNWNNGQKANPAMSLLAGFYTVTVSDINGCSKTSSYEVTQPEAIKITTNTSHVKCIGESNGAIEVTVRGGLTPYKYLWSDGNTDEDRTNLLSGTYILTVTDDNGTFQPTLVVINEGVQLKFESIIDKVTCNAVNNGKISLSITGGSGNYDYLWSNSETGSVLLNAYPDITYSVVITDKVNGCTISSGSIIIGKEDDIYVDTIVKNVSCKDNADGSISLLVSGGSGKYDWKWNNGQQTSMLASLSAGLYSVTVSDEKGCRDSLLIKISEPEFGINVIVNSTKPYCIESTDGGIGLQLEGDPMQTYTYQWSDGSNGDSLSNISSGEYAYTVTDSKGCTKEGSISLKNEEGTCLVIPTAFSPNGDGHNDYWKMDNLMMFYPNVSVKVFNRWGEEIFSSKGYTKPWDGTYRGKSLPVDSYHYIIDFGNNTKPKLGQVTIIK